MRILGKKAFRLCARIREIATPAARDQNFCARIGIVLQHQNGLPAQARIEGVEQTSGARANHNGIEYLRHGLRVTR